MNVGRLREKKKGLFIMKFAMKQITPIAAAFAVAFAVSASLATPSAAQTAKGMPYLSDGSQDISIQINGGAASFHACGRKYYLPNEYSLRSYKSMRSKLRRGGYIYYHTDNMYKKWYACGWGSYKHLNGVLK